MTIFCIHQTEVTALKYSYRSIVGSHSLWTLQTFIIGETPFPQYSFVVKVDDVEIGYHVMTHNTSTNVYKIPGAYDEDSRYGNIYRRIMQDEYKTVKEKALALNRHFNHSDGVHVHQRQAGCQVMDNGQALTLSHDAFDGEKGEEYSYNAKTNTVQPNRYWPALSQKMKHDEIFTLFHASVSHHMCVATLKYFLSTLKNIVMRKVKPRVRILQKTLPDSGGVKVTCLATGFYPRHINLTLLRDGQPVSDHQTTGGELLPNGDETYQMRKSLEVSAEELQHNHYTCTAEHLSLDNKLDFGLEYEPGLDVVAIVSSVLVFLLLSGIGAAAGFIIWKRRHTVGSQTSSVASYTATPNTEAEETPNENS
ncbi:major histocompatibility complex class I-related gene protein-like isoform X4 [Alosa alosa]|uniref:major histocompatibility complex class I-related gene protein-like isoform X4 n=1 Tax=Alosa alosa TaxID=278164 RepID=UPI0020154137|nr:major histocompatibility complex class I-related gene protein-like isoform X4 [Alosa alosa]XP_048090886.1 major histocompatibility complex class I-related gene protein-like isoform X4 [Alosa alosa]XP_048090887.1 major histocompatibility complex class I-related gene protein-like isoform X4 [Alosa alosa]